MYTRVNKSKGNSSQTNRPESRAVANTVMQNRSIKPTLQFEDRQRKSSNIKNLQLKINEINKSTSIHGPGCPCCSSKNILQKKEVNKTHSGTSNHVLQLTNDMKCKATVEVKGTKYEATGMNDQGYASSAESNIGTWSLLSNKFSTVKQKTNQSIYGCAEPIALSNAVEKMKKKDKVSKKKDVDIEISDAIMLKNFPNQGLAIGNVKPRCVNCRQWVPENTVNL